MRVRGTNIADEIYIRNTDQKPGYKMKISTIEDGV